MANDEKGKRMNINLRLPGDIVMVIFSKLCFSNFPNCRIVCKAWNDLVLDYADSSTKFHPLPNAFLLCTLNINLELNSRYLNSKMHCIDLDTNSSVATFRFDGNWRYVKFLSSCNGLLYVYKSALGFHSCNGIWNPMTNEFFQLPDLVEKLYMFGFGFSYKTKQYKLFRIFQSINTVEVLSFGIDKELQWRGSKVEPPFNIINHGSYFDGVIYWIGKNQTNEILIYGLDVETEAFETIAILDIGPYFIIDAYTLPFNDTIFAVITIPGERQVWVMKAKHMWIREFVIHLQKSHPFCLIKTSEDEGKLFFTVDNDLFYVDKIGKITKIKTLFNSNSPYILFGLPIQSFHFGSLSKILAGNDSSLSSIQSREDRK